jgi:two-component system chemotaxis response regulator CheB
MGRRNIVVIGASAGGMEALKHLVEDLPRDLDATLFVVWHMPADFTTTLPRLLTRAGPFPAEHPQDGQPIEPRRVYVAVPDHHLLLEHGRIRVTRGPRENRFRPAVDPLFRSAAYVYGSRVIGVVLTGALDDGTAGLWTIKLRGGTAIVQDPGEALHPSMPRNALENVEVDHVARLAGIAQLIGKLTREEAPEAPELPMDEQRKTETEIRVAKEHGALSIDMLGKGELSPFTCPECHGVLTRLQEGRIFRYRCHTGHAFSADALLASLGEQAESRLWDAVRALDETVMLLDHMGRHLEEAGQPEAAKPYFENAREAEARGDAMRQAAQGQEPVSKERLRAKLG